MSVSIHSLHIKGMNVTALEDILIKIIVVEGHNLLAADSNGFRYEVLQII